MLRHLPGEAASPGPHNTLFYDKLASAESLEPQQLSLEGFKAQLEAVKDQKVVYLGAPPRISADTLDEVKGAVGKMQQECVDKLWPEPGWHRDGKQPHMPGDAGDVP